MKSSDTSWTGWKSIKKMHNANEPFMFISLDLFKVQKNVLHTTFGSKLHGRLSLMPANIFNTSQFS